MARLVLAPEDLPRPARGMTTARPALPSVACCRPATDFLGEFRLVLGSFDYSNSDATEAAANAASNLASSFFCMWRAVSSTTSTIVQRRSSKPAAIAGVWPSRLACFRTRLIDAEHQRGRASARKPSSSRHGGSGIVQAARLTISALTSPRGSMARCKSPADGHPAYKMVVGANFDLDRTHFAQLVKI